MVTRYRVGTNRPVERLTFQCFGILLNREDHIVMRFIMSQLASAMRVEYICINKKLVLGLLFPSTIGYVNVVGVCGFYITNILPDGTLSRYKSLLVANGSTQLEGVDVDETFSPVVKPETIRTVLSLDASFLDTGLFISCGTCQECIFTSRDLFGDCLMHHPTRFWDSTYPTLCGACFKCFFMGLKQAAALGSAICISYITGLGFNLIVVLVPLFIFHQGNDTTYLLLYVDDIVLTASCSNLLHRIISSLHQEFAMTDLGSLNYFLGISVTRDSSGMFLSQKKYAVKILECVGEVVSISTLYRLYLAGRSTSSYCCLSWQQYTLLVVYYAVNRRFLVPSADGRSIVGVAMLLLRDPVGYATYCHQRTKHIEIYIHFVRDLVDAGQVRVLHVPSRYEFEDIFTKGLPTTLFEEFRSSLSEYRARVHVKSKLHYLPMLKDRLGTDRCVLFRETCFGCWLDLTCVEKDESLIHYMLQKQKISDNDHYDLPLIYNVNGHTLHFGRREFCLISGFKFGFLSFRKFREGDITFRDRVFPHKIGEYVKNIDLLSLIEDEDRFISLSDSDSVRVCLLLALEVIFMGHELGSAVDDVFLRMVEDLDIWNNFPWGEYMWRELYGAIRNVNLNHKQEHLKALEINPNFVLTYSLSGFLLAFKVSSIVETLFQSINP
ncbi:phospholipase-like, aminotransferase-like mobile domain protein [Tanacetum coccineum]